MRLINNTPLPAALIPNAEGDETMTALFVVSATYRLGEGVFELARAQRPLILLDDRPLSHDAHFMKSVVSVCATGHVYAPGGEATQASARLRVGDIENEVVAFGPRVWQPGITAALSPSRPEPFARVPMAWERAFGGKVFIKTSVATIDGEETIIPEHNQGFPLNPDGVGFYTDASQARGQPLPQLENPAWPIRSVTDRPEPVCFAPYPLYGGLRAATVVHDGKVDLGQVGRLYSRAAPRTSFRELPRGTPVHLSGMRPDGEALAFAVPEALVSVAVLVGDRGSLLELKLDAIDIDADAAEVRVVHRALFQYDLIQYEKRKVRVDTNEAFRGALPKG